MMKTRYNKKRNTAFVYEALIREGTSAILQGDHDRKNTVVKLIKKHFDWLYSRYKVVDNHRINWDKIFYKKAYHNE